MSDAPTQLKTLLHLLVSPALSRPAFLRINDVGTPKMVVLQIQVAEEDIGRIVGKGGSNIIALKALMAGPANALSQPFGITVGPGSPGPSGAEHAWDISAVELAVNALLVFVSGEDASAVFVDGKPGQKLVLLSGKVPETVTTPLSRWLSVMAAPGKVHIVLDDSTHKATAT